MADNPVWIYTIDPSINYCGVALHMNGELFHYTLIKPYDRNNDHITKANSVFAYLKEDIEYQLEEYGIHSRDFIIVYELPQYWGVAGHAARESGSIGKLMFLCGLISSLNNMYCVRCIKPSEWKGQMPKNVVKNRMIKEYPDVNFNSLKHDIVDAIGIGRYILDEIIKYKGSLNEFVMTDLKRIKWSVQS